MLAIVHMCSRVDYVELAIYSAMAAVRYAYPDLSQKWVPWTEQP